MAQKKKKKKCGSCVECRILTIALREVIKKDKGLMAPMPGLVVRSVGELEWWLRQSFQQYHYRVLVLC
jgi:hypothetical protein